MRPGARAIAAAVLGVSLLAAAPSRAQEAVSVDGLTIRAAWLRATPNGAKVAGGYLTVVNAGAGEDRLIGASLEVAPRGEVHTMAMRDGVMHMERLRDGLAIAPGATVILKPGGDHLMFLDPTAPLKEGDHAAGTLTFAKAGTIKVTFTVGAIAAKTAP